MKLLLIGDPHVTPANIPESERLMDFVLLKLAEYKPDAILILGDLFHTHLILRLEVIEFWKYWTSKLSKNYTTIILSGNHDQMSDHNREWDTSSLTTLDSLGAKLVYSEPYEWNDILFIPHTHNKEKFIQICEKSKKRLLVCHQTFDGSQFENGFYAPDGIDQNLIPSNFDRIISGHIHKQQCIGRVWYPGTPKWDSISDANEEKGIWIYDTQLDEKTFISTNSVCTPIKSFEVMEGEKIPEIPTGCTSLLILKGSSQWIAKVSKQYKGKAKISAKPTDFINKKAPDNHLSDIVAYSKMFNFPTHISVDRVLSIIGEYNVL